jgi:prepilin-type N-terminal cleavage/methylation domain-containing protein
MQCARAASRTGFTLLEIIVTITLLGVGVAAVVRTSAAIARVQGAGERRERAANLASARFERLRAAPCAAAAGADRDRAIVARWSATVGDGARRLEDDITIPDGPSERRELVRSATPC